MKIDLDAAKAARREATEEPPTIVFGGTEFVLPVELPYEVAESLASFVDSPNDQKSVALADVARSFLGDYAADFMRLRPSIKDLLELVNGVMKAYGFSDVETGEAEDEPPAGS